MIFRHLRSALVLAAFATFSLSNICQAKQTSSPNWGVEEQQTLAACLETGDTTTAAAKRILPLLRQQMIVSNTAFAQQQMDAWHEALKRRLSKEFPNIKVSGNAQTYGTQLFLAGNTNDAVKVLLMEAELMRAPSIMLLQLIYLNKCEGYQAHDQRMLRFFEQTAAEGSPRSRLVLAEIYYACAGVNQNVDKAIELLQNNKLSEAQTLLAAIYREQGRLDDALAIYSAQADAGLAAGHFNLAVGLQMKGDTTNAFSHFEKSLELDAASTRTMVNLGQCYIEGWGVKADPTKGFKLYKQAADAGDVVAMVVVSRLYDRGIGVKASAEEAQHYLNLARSAEGSKSMGVGER